MHVIHGALKGIPYPNNKNLYQDLPLGELNKYKDGGGWNYK